MRKRYNSATTDDVYIKATKATSPQSKARKSPKIEVISRRKKTDLSKTADSKTKQSKTAKTKELKELERLNEENIAKYSARSKRNSVIIGILLILIGLCIAYNIVYFTVILKKSNCFIETVPSTKENVTFYIGGKKLDAWRTPASFKSGTIYTFNADIKINADGEYIVKYNVDLYSGKTKIKDFYVHEPNIDVFSLNKNLTSTKQYVSRTAVNGGEVLRMCNGIRIDRDFSKKLSPNTFKMKITIELEKVN
ncbi:MAG: hypothetical protein E7374_01795 [Clostridiales bacterium]|nr:hypothetical protein [Clostridiales bacterium]